MSYAILEKLAAFMGQPHQEDVAEKLKKQDAVLVYHGMGSGKTISALLAGERLKRPLTVVGPASLRHNFESEKKKFHLKTPVKTFTYNKPPESVGKDDVVVFDEAHRMGSMASKRSHLTDTLKGHKTIFLTGTPIRNKPSELIPLLRGIGAPVPRDEAKFNDEFIQKVKVNPGLFARIFRGVKPGIEYRAQNLDRLKKMVEGKISYKETPKEGYPSVRESTINVDMTPEQETTYKMALKNDPGLSYKIRKGIAPSKTESGKMNAFLTATRQISNMPGEYNLSSSLKDAPKINRALEEIKSRAGKDPNYRGVTYSNYIGHGISPLAQLLEKEKIPSAMYTGKIPQKKRDQMIKDYNSGKVKQLLISGAGGEGLNLRGTKILQILEPHWNEPTLDQVKARAVRFKSHEHLPIKERGVEIQNFIARPREHGFIFKSRDMGTDEYLRNMAGKKEALNSQFLKALQEAGTE